MIKPKKRNKNNISKGVDEKNNVEMEDRRKNKIKWQTESGFE